MCEDVTPRHSTLREPRELLRYEYARPYALGNAILVGVRGNPFLNEPNREITSQRATKLRCPAPDAMSEDCSSSSRALPTHSGNERSLECGRGPVPREFA